MASPAELVLVAGAGGGREELPVRKGLVGLDQHQVCRSGPWYRWTALSMAAHALLTMFADAARDLEVHPATWRH